MSNMRELVCVHERKEGAKGFWTRVGTAFENRDGSWSLQFDYFPTFSGGKTTIQMRDIREKTDKPAQPTSHPLGSDDSPF